MIPAPEANDPFQFLGHDGQVADLIRNFRWSETPLGPAVDWPQPLKTVIALVLQSPVPIVMLWGEEGVMIYNDAYSVFAGARHPALLGSNVREGWAEIADFNDNVMRVGLAGGTLAYRDQELTLHRKGYPESVWMDLDYSPVLDERGRPAGVIAIVVETTERVLAERRSSEEFHRLQNLFSQAPTFMAMLRGPDHEFELFNPEYSKLVGHRNLTGLPVSRALPELLEQGVVDLLDRTFTSGVPAQRTAERVLLRRSNEGALEERFIDFVCQPIRDDLGAVTHIFIQGSDVTQRVRAENRQRLLVNELNHRVKNTLASIQSIVGQTLRSAATQEEASRAITARILALSRAHDVLTNESWDGADLRTMVESAVDAFQMPDRDCFRISGPRMRIGPHAAMSLALAVHELATNAVKYGALSVPGGEVDIQWQLGPEDLFRFEWIERGGPVVTKSERRGFGSRLIHRVLSHELRGQAETDFRPSGIIFTLTTSAAAVNDKPALIEELDGAHPDR